MQALEYGLVAFPDTRNLGDDIQTIAARRFLPRVDRLLDREALDAVTGAPATIRTILNGWYMHAPQNWPPSAAIDPLITSFHMAGSVRSRWWWPLGRTAAEVMLSGAGRDYLMRHAPIGARDRSTLAALQKAGIPAYFSGCLTLTLPRCEAARGDTIVACDLPEPIARELERRYPGRVIRTTHIFADALPDDVRSAQAQALLDLYGAARAVVTTRVHCALPCLALGTPVLYVPLRSDVGRKSIATDLAHHCSERDFLSRAVPFDPNDPPENPPAYLPLRDALIAQCQAFVAARS